MRHIDDRRRPFQHAAIGLFHSRREDGLLRRIAERLNIRRRGAVRSFIAGAASDERIEHGIEELALQLEGHMLGAGVALAIKATLAALSLQNFPVEGKFPPDEFVQRVSRYEAAIRDLASVIVLVARWSPEAEASFLLENVLARVAEADKGNGGINWWLALGWYPVLVLTYAAGIAALAARRPRLVASAIMTPVQLKRSGQDAIPVIAPTIDCLDELGDQFRQLPGLERHRLARSQHLFAQVRPILDEGFLLGESYSALFDRFELLVALAYADFRESTRKTLWGPPGLFVFKHGSPVDCLVSEAEAQKSAWPFLASGLFGGNCDRFLKVAAAYKKLLSASNFS